MCTLKCSALRRPFIDVLVPLHVAARRSPEAPRSA
jgi:hypothetical protein